MVRVLGTSQSWAAGLAVVAAFSLPFVLGCGKGDKPAADGEPNKVAHHDGDGHDHRAGEGEKKGHSHEGWWCDEHGIPEEICGQCSASYAAECKKKGDWCKEHDRPDSQCFVCHPELKEKFAAMYREKNDGKEPPPITE